MSWYSAGPRRCHKKVELDEEGKGYIDRRTYLLLSKIAICAKESTKNDCWIS